MRTAYTKPMVEKIEFDYQIVTATSGNCKSETTYSLDNSKSLCLDVRHEPTFMA